MTENAKGTRRRRALEEITVLKGRRRIDIIKCSFAIMAAVLVIAGKPYLETIEVLPVGSVLVLAMMFLSAVALAAFAGAASTDFAKSGRRIEELRSRYGISQDDIRSFERS